MPSHRTRNTVQTRSTAGLLAIALAIPMAIPLAIIPVANAFAAADEAMDEIVVTVRQRSESIKDVPGAITVLTAEQIEASGIQRAEDFIYMTPGVTIVNSAEVADTQVNIRGINGSRDAQNSYALIIDGILMTDPAALNREYADLQQIEILKGPQGALYGRNAAAGAIVITTARPGEQLGGEIKASVAQDSTYLVSASISGPASDQLGWSLHADYRSTDGFYQNVFLGTDDTMDQFESWNVSGRLVWEPSDTLTIDTKLRYGEVDAASITFNSVFNIPGFPAIIESFGFPPEFAAAGFEDVNDHPFQFNPNINSFNNQEALELSVKADKDLGWADLTSWLLYSNIDNDLGSDGTSGAFGFFFQESLCRSTTNDIALSGFQLGAPQALAPEAFGGPNASIFGAYTPTTCDGTQYQLRNQEDISFEVRLASKDDQQLRWLAGFYYLNIDREVGVNLGIDRGQGIIRSLFTTNPANPTEQLVHDNFDTDVYAVFGQLAYDVTDDVELALALRYDREERKVQNLVPAGATTQWIVCTPGDPFTGGDPINPGLCPGINPGGVIADKNKTFSELQPKLSLTWDALDNLTAFASIGVGFKSGGFNNQGAAATVDLFINEPLITGPGAPFPSFAPVGIQDQFDKETSTSYELGFKSDFADGRVRLEAAYYNVDVEDMQFFEFLVGSFGLLRVVSNIDEVNISGVEASISWATTDWLDLYAGANFIDSEIKKNTARPDTIGNESPYTPEYTLNLGGRVALPVTRTWNFIASVDVSAVGKTWFHVVQDNNRRPTTFFLESDMSVAQRDSYTLVNARAGIANDNWSLTVFARNLFDQDYLEEVIPAPEFGGSFTHPGTQRRIGAEAVYRF